MQINQKKENRWVTICLIVLAAAGIALRVTAYYPYSDLAPIVMAALCIFWGTANSRRTALTDVRKLLLASAVLLTLIYVLEISAGEHISANANLPQLPLISRLYVYIKQAVFSAVTLFSYLVSTGLGSDVREQPIKRRKWLFVPLAIIIAAIFTNEFHGFYRAIGSDGILGETSYVFYAVIAWQIIFIIAAMTVTAYRCRHSGLRLTALFPVVIALILLAAYAYYAYLRYYFNIPDLVLWNIGFIDVFTILTIFFWEACVLIGLLPSNNDYARVFDQATVNAQIADHRGDILYTTSKAAPLAAGQAFKSVYDPVMLDENTRLHGRPIHGGYVYWTADVTAVNVINSRLKSTGDRLAEETAIIKKENDLFAERERFRSENALFDRLANEVRPQLEAIDGLLADGEEGDDFELRKDLVKASILCAYIKRRTNLFMLAKKNKPVEMADLYLSVRESLDYLSLLGISCDVTTDSAARLNGEHALMAYDYFQHTLERAFPTLSTLRVNLEYRGGLTLALALDPDADLPSELWHSAEVEALGGRIVVSRDDYCSYVVIAFAEGGRRI